MESDTVDKIKAWLIFLIICVQFIFMMVGIVLVGFDKWNLGLEILVLDAILSLWTVHYVDTH